MTIPAPSSDEILARALQGAYDAGYHSSQPNSSNRPSPTAPHAEESFGDYARRIEAPTRALHASALETVEQDAAYARRIEEQERALYESAMNRSKRSLYTVTAPTSHNDSRTSTAGTTSDAAYARRVEQELQDEEVARQMTNQEETRASTHRAHVLAAQSAPLRACSVRRICSYLIPLAIIGGIVVGTLVLFNNSDSFPDWLPDFENFADEDPFNSTGPEGADRWKSNGEGLTMEIVNALDDDWYSFFYQAVDDWDAGTPDVLTLTTSVRAPDFECTPINGKIKVCNGDYGNTDWRGINQILIRNGFIFASTAKMNENYLNGVSSAQKQYTMCHETGHGFGLPHTDVNFYNADRGECMDYTDSPANNDQPGPENFEFLAVMYGVPEGSQTAVTTSAVQPGERRVFETVDTEDEALPDWLLSKLQQVVPAFENRMDGKDYEEGWRLLHRSLHGVAHEMDLGDDYSVRVRKLHV